MISVLAYAKAQVTSNSCIRQTDGVQEGEQRNTLDAGDDAQVPMQRAAAAWHAALADGSRREGQHAESNVHMMHTTCCSMWAVVLHILAPELAHRKQLHGLR